MLAQFLTQRIEYCLTRICEAAEDQHRLGSDGVDHVTDFLVVEHEVDELCDFNVIDSNVGLALWCDNQVLLLGPLQFYIPCRYTEYATAGEISVRKVSVY